MSGLDRQIRGGGTRGGHVSHHEQAGELNVSSADSAKGECLCRSGVHFVQTVIVATDTIMLRPEQLAGLIVKGHRLHIISGMTGASDQGDGRIV